ncbi:integrase, catalytic region, zinc finger, CCHC-type containing protein, partial [Tanacetum coccineum]
HNYIGSEHLMLGSLREGEGVTDRVLEKLGADPSNIRTHVTEAYDALDPNGNITIKLDVMRWTPGGYVIVIIGGLDGVKINKGQYVLEVFIDLRSMEEKKGIKLTFVQPISTSRNKAYGQDGKGKGLLWFKFCPWMCPWCGMKMVEDERYNAKNNQGRKMIHFRGKIETMQKRKGNEKPIKCATIVIGIWAIALKNVLRQKRLQDSDYFKDKVATNAKAQERNSSPPPPDYSKENFLATFAPQRNLTPEQIFWSIDDNNRKKAETLAPKPISALTVYPPNTPVKLVPRILPTKSQVKINLYVLTQLFTEFDKTCKTRITPTGITEGERGFEQTKRCYLTEVIPFFKTLKEHFVGVQTALFKEVKEMEEIFDQMNNEVDKNTVDKQCAEIEKKNLLIENENLIVNCLSTQLLYDVEKSRCLDLEADMSKVHDESKLISKLEGECLNLQLKYQHLQESFDNNKSHTVQEAPDFNSFFKIKNLEHQIQEKDNVIRNLKVIVANVNDRSCEPYNAKDVTALIEQNDCVRVELEKVKQHYKELYDSIKITRAHTSEKTSTMLNEIESLKAQLRSKESCFTSDYVKPKVLAPGMYAIDVKPIPHPLKNNRSAHLNYISHLKESVETVREIVEEARVVKPLDNTLNYACQYTKLQAIVLEYVMALAQKVSMNEITRLLIPLLLGKAKLHLRVTNSTEASGSKASKNPQEETALGNLIVVINGDQQERNLHSEMCHPTKLSVKMSLQGHALGNLVILILKVASERHTCFVRDIRVQTYLKGCWPQQNSQIIRTDNGYGIHQIQVMSEFYEGVGIFHQKSVPRTPQQNGVVLKDVNRTWWKHSTYNVEYLESTMFLWAKLNMVMYWKNKARLVNLLEKGYRQEEGIDFEDSFAPVARIEASDIHCKCGIQEYVHLPDGSSKLVFSDGDLKEKVFVSQPEGFERPG